MDDGYFLVSPESDQFELLSEVDRCEWDVADGSSGLQDINFRQLMEAIAKSITASRLQMVQRNIPDRRALFGQDGW